MVHLLIMPETTLPLAEHGSLGLQASGYMNLKRGQGCGGFAGLKPELLRCQTHAGSRNGQLHVCMACLLVLQILDERLQDTDSCNL